MLQRGRQDDDGYRRTLRPEPLGNLRAKLALAQVVVQHRNVHRVEHLVGFLSRRGTQALIPVLAQNRTAQQQVCRVVVQQQQRVPRRQDPQCRVCMSSPICGCDAPHFQGVTPNSYSAGSPTARRRLLTSRTSSGSRANEATARSHWRLFIAG